MLRHHLIDDRTLRRLIRTGEAAWAGNAQLRIYGRLDCKSGRRMKRQNRVFFGTDAAPLALGFRPCGHCLRREYLLWKKTQDPT